MSGSVLWDAAFGASIGFAFACLLTAYGILRDPRKAVRVKRPPLLDFTTPVPRAQAQGRVLAAPTANYRIEDVADGRVILSSQGNLLTNHGFFFPVYFTDVPDGSTLVEVGIVPRGASDT
jgi:hypothetical protein